MPSRSPGSISVRSFLWLACGVCVVSAGGCGEPLVAPGLSSGVLSAADTAPVSGEAAWSAWRGGPMQAVASTTGPVRWSRRDNVRWYCPIPGEGNSSPVLSQQHVYVTSAIADHGTKLTVLAVRRDTGELAWMTPVELSTSPQHQKAGRAPATAAHAAGRVFAYFGAAGLAALDAGDGHMLWHVPFPEATHQWGAASSPALADDLVLQLVESEQGHSALVALRQADGHEVWRASRESRGCWTSPAVCQAPGLIPQVIVNGSGQPDGSPGWIISYELATGRELWRHRGTSDICVPTAIVAGDIVVSASGNNGPLLALRITAAGPRLLWQRPVGGAQVPTGLVADGRLYLLSDGGALSCRDLTTGAVLWNQRLGGAMSASLLASRHHLYATNEQGTTYVVDRSAEFSLVARNPLDERCLATPALGDGELFLRGRSGLYCFGAGPTTSTAAQSKVSPEIRETATGTPALRPELAAFESGKHKNELNTNIKNKNFPRAGDPDLISE